MLKSRSKIDYELGIEWYMTDTEGIKGKLRTKPEDFIVEEILINGEIIHTSLTSNKLPNIQEKPGNYVWIVVEKKCIDTISVALKLSKSLGVELSKISYAGLKDTQAITCQIFSIENISIEDIKELNFDSKILIKGFYRMDKPFTIQEIWGNRFIITIREVEDINRSFEIVEKCINQVQKFGILNYYGYQRFGLKKPNSHLIGKYIILRDFEKAIREFLCISTPDESEKMKKVREYACKGDYAKALEYLPKSVKYYSEYVVLKTLARNSKDYVTAFRRLPRDLLRLYVESYQSYLFNKMLSLRIEYGPINQVIPGDYVVLLDQYKLPTRHVIYVTESLVDKMNKLLQEEKIVIVLPLIGYDFKTSSKLIQEITSKILKEEGIEPKNFYIKEIPEIAIKGSYRTIVVKPVIENVEKLENENAIRITFRLPRGSYATMLLREILKPENPLEAGF